MILQRITLVCNPPLHYLQPSSNIEARGSVVVKVLRYKPEGRGFDTRWGEFLNLPNPGVYSASNRNEYQKHKNNNVSGE
jgi:hypothetical protein